MSDGVVGQVTDLFDSTGRWLEQLMDMANEAIGSLADVDFPYTVYGSIANPTVDVKSLEPSTLEDVEPLPAEPDIIEVKMPEVPKDVDIAIPTEPSISYPTIPQKPSIITPTMESVTLGTMLGLIIPGAPAINFKDFSLERPENLSIDIPSFQFALEAISGEAIINDELYRAAKTRLINNIEKGGTGLLPEIENAIWQRDLERNEQALMDSRDKITTAWAKKGFSLPDGMLANSIAILQVDYQNRRIDRSREIAIKQAELEQTNLFKSLELGSDLFYKLNDLLLKFQDFALRTQEDTANFFNEYIDLQIKKHNQNIEVYKAAASVYEAEIRAQLGKVEVFKAQIEAELAKVKINEQQVSVYSAQITAAIAKYRGVLDGNESITKIFSSEVQAALAIAQIEETKLKAYAEEVRACLAKADIYRSRVEAMAAQARVSVATSEVNVANMQAWSERVRAINSKYLAKVEKYKAETAYNISAAEIAARVGDINGKLLLATAEINKGYNELNQKSIQAKAMTVIEQLKTVAELTSHMASGALAALSAHASIGYSETKSLDA